MENAALISRTYGERIVHEMFGECIVVTEVWNGRHPDCPFREANYPFATIKGVETITTIRPTPLRYLPDHRHPDTGHASTDEAKGRGGAPR